MQQIENVKTIWQTLVLQHGGGVTQDLNSREPNSLCVNINNKMKGSVELTTGPFTFSRQCHYCDEPGQFEHETITDKKNVL